MASWQTDQQLSFQPTTASSIGSVNEGHWRVIANSGQTPLLGVGLLLAKELRVDYSNNESLIISVVFMWIGSALIASDMLLGTWFTAGPMMLVPALSTIWVFVLSLQRFRFRHLAAGLCSWVLPLIGFIAKGCRV